MNPENGGCVELESKEDKVLAVVSDRIVEESVRNFQLGFPILHKEDELIVENNKFSELELKEDKVQGLNSDRNIEVFGESDQNS
ncbi:hypothetical protein FXO38_12638 [Capsicum annuum]|uniref:Uncharacterized protein n=1 Tax=Capsicum annuum TaxID=4072 RepID=A0A2G2YW96_CAPAN|nr:hypothetical protein FXO38_12638 [Capsicum annuum]KAF3683949.1 hypothetical protein FXO37_01594 [Capsicum annuum]PHT74040.1 hypothetical protein T459_21317 [Capsicum annuum]